MQLTCPQCDQPITADHINIQRMVAACPACDNVFQFTPPEPKLKRRKARQPRRLQLDEAEDLHIAYRTLFRLDKDENFINSGALSVVFTFITILMTSLYLAGEVPLVLPILFGLAALPMYYWLGLIVFNKTHINMDDVAIKVSRQPLPNIGHARQIDLSGLTSISAEETSASKQKEYDTPRCHVWANLSDGSRRLIAADLIEEYAYFIAQTLDKSLQRDTSRLTAAERGEDDESLFIAEAAHQRESPNHRR